MGKGTVMVIINDVCIVLAILAMTAVILGVGRIGGRGSRYAITMIVVAMIRRREYKAREILPPRSTKAQFTEWVRLPNEVKCSKEWDWFTGLNDGNRAEWLQKVEGKK